MNVSSIKCRSFRVLAVPAIVLALGAGTVLGAGGSAYADDLTPDERQTVAARDAGVDLTDHQLHVLHVLHLQHLQAQGVTLTPDELQTLDSYEVEQANAEAEAQTQAEADAQALARRITENRRRQAEVGRYPVQTSGGLPLTVRSAAKTSADAVGRVAHGTFVYIICQVTDGASVNGSTVWDKIGPDRWVSDAFVVTGASGSVTESCAADVSEPVVEEPTTAPGGESKRAIEQAEIDAAVEAVEAALSAYSYDYHIPIGDIDPTTLGITPESITASFLQDFDNQFQFSGCGPVVEGPKDCTLQGFGQMAPVRITRVWATGFELLSLPGHPEGPDRSITFNLTKGYRGLLYLDVSASGPATVFWTDNPVGVFINSALVNTIWHDWANKMADQHDLRTLDYYLKGLED